MESGFYSPATPVSTTPPPIFNSHTPVMPGLKYLHSDHPLPSQKVKRPDCSGEKHFLQIVLERRRRSFLTRTIVTITISISIAEGPIPLPPLWTRNKKAPGARRNTPYRPRIEHAGEVHQQEAPVRSVHVSGSPSRKNQSA